MPRLFNAVPSHSLSNEENSDQNLRYIQARQQHKKSQGQTNFAQNRREVYLEDPKPTREMRLQAQDIATKRYPR